MTKLEDQRKILEKNIRREDDMVKNKKTYTNPQTGQKIGPEHYKKAADYDAKTLANVNKQIKLKNAIKKATGVDAEKVSEVGSPNVGSMAKDLLKNKTVKKVAQKVSEVGKETAGSMAKDLLNKKKRK